VARELIRQIQKRAAALDRRGDPSAIQRYAFAKNESEVALASGRATSQNTAQYTTFVVSDENLGPDRDGDVVSTRGIDTAEWAAAGAPWFLSHQQGNDGLTVGSSLDSNGKLWFWEKDGRAYARCYWSNDSPIAKAVSQKYRSKSMRACSIAFVPRIASRLDGDYKSAPYRREQGAGGMFYSSVSLTEISLVGVGASPAALSVDKSLAGCSGSGCFTRWAPRQKGRGACCAGCKQGGPCRRKTPSATQADIESGRTDNLIDRTGEEPPMQQYNKPSAVALAKIAAQVAQITPFLDRLGMDNPSVERALRKAVRENIEPFSETLRALAAEHHGDYDYDSAVKGLLDELQTGERGRVDQGDVPDDDLPFEQEKQGATEEILDRYETPEPMAPRRGRGEKQVSAAVVARANQLALRVARETGVRVPTIPVY
jgi:hypothetical protein